MLVGQRTTPSVVAFADDGTRHVGDVAKRQVSYLDASQYEFFTCEQRIDKNF